MGGSAMGVEVKLVDAAARFDAPTGAARGHIQCALSLCKGNGVWEVTVAVGLIRCGSRHRMIGPPACLGTMIITALARQPLS